MVKVLIVYNLHPEQISYYICDVTDYDLELLLKYNGLYINSCELIEEDDRALSNLHFKYRIEENAVTIPLNKSQLETIDYIIETGFYL